MGDALGGIGYQLRHILNEEEQAKLESLIEGLKTLGDATLVYSK
jgi:hypothetical protein